MPRESPLPVRRVSDDLRPSSRALTSSQTLLCVFQERRRRQSADMSPKNQNGFLVSSPHLFLSEATSLVPPSISEEVTVQRGGGGGGGGGLERIRKQKTEQSGCSEAQQLPLSSPRDGLLLLVLFTRLSIPVPPHVPPSFHGSKGTSRRCHGL